MFLKISQVSQEKTYVGVSFNKVADLKLKTFLYKTHPVATFETKHTHVSAADLLHIRIGNFDWCKWGHCKNEAREIDCLCCRRWMQCLLVRLNSRSAREASRHAAFMGNCPTVSHTC